MIIAVNTRLLLKNRLEGIGWFSYESLKRIAQNHKEHRFIFIFDRPYDESFVFSENIQPVFIYPQARHPVLYYLWFEHSIPYILKKYKADLFFSPEGYLSLSSDVKQVNVFHDLNFEYYPADLPFAERYFYRHYYPLYARKAKRIATVSEYSRQDISKLYKIDPDIIDVVYNGVNEKYSPVNDQVKEKTRTEYTRGCEYFVFVGALHPRKNIRNLFLAFDHFRNAMDSNIKLLVVGEKKWWTSAIEEAYENMKYKDEVIFAGRLSPEKLNSVIGSALALTYVSYFEGFGIPMVEAFSTETPVITSNVTCLPEIAGNAALLTDPFSIESIADAMKQIAFNPELREQLISKGNDRKMLYSWDKTAVRLWNCLEKVMENRD